MILSIPEEELDESVLEEEDDDDDDEDSDDELSLFNS